jgi:hypothetical protein
MKYSLLYVSILADASNAIPLPQFSLPFSLPTGGLSLPTGFPLPTGGLALPTGVSPPGFGNGLQATATSSGVAQPTSSGSSTSIDQAGCSAQGNGGGDEENGVANKNCCADLTVIFARGSTETGNVGAVAGPPMFKALRSKLGVDRVLVQGVEYPASLAVSYVGSIGK